MNALIRAAAQKNWWKIITSLLHVEALKSAKKKRPDLQPTLNVLNLPYFLNQLVNMSVLQNYYYFCVTYLSLFFQDGSRGGDVWDH